MAALVLYTGYTYLFQPSSGDNGDQRPQIQELKDFVRETNRLIKENELGKRRSYSLNRAKEDWQRNPFYHPPLEEGEGKEDVEVEGKFVYSGYLESGETRMAIINGLEYESGESLKGGGFVLQSISPDRVIISVTGKEQTITVPIRE